MNVKTWAALAVLASIPAAARADIVEVRGKGMLSGKILSQDDQGMTFRDSDGHEMRLAIGDVTYFDRETASAKASEPGAAGESPFTRVKRVVADTFADVPLALRRLRSWTDRQTRKFRDLVGKPINRKAADAKSEQLNKTLKEAQEAVSALAKKNKKVNQEIRRQRAPGGGWKKQEEESGSGFDGTFGHL